MVPRGSPRFRLFFFAVLLLILGAAVLWRLQAGDMHISPAVVAEILFSSSPEATPQEILVVRSIRFPRLFASLAAGASLAVSGAVLQEFWEIRWPIPIHSALHLEPLLGPPWGYTWEASGSQELPLQAHWLHWGLPFFSRGERRESPRSPWSCQGSW